MKLPPQYAYLNHEPGPPILVEMLKLYGIKEILGPASNAAILAWAKEVGANWYKSDATPWCGLTVGIAAKRAGLPYKPKGNPLFARNWASWGVPQRVAMLGDVLTFPRGSGGHNGIYVGEDRDFYHILGGNQNDQVNIKRRAKSPILAIRRSPGQKYANVRRIKLSTFGPVAIKEK